MPTTFNPAEVCAAASLWSAMSSGSTIPPPRLSMVNPGVAEGYRVQALNVRRWESIGRKVVGHKIAMTSAAIQKQFGVDHPTRGVLLDSMLLRSGARIFLPDGSLQGRAEAEVAFVLRHDLDAPRPAFDDTVNAIAHAYPAIEIVHSRVTNWDVTPFDFVADNAAAAFVILGSNEMQLKVHDPAMITMQMELNGQVSCRGTGADCLGSPLRALHWLALHLFEHGDSLKKDDLVMSGSLGPALPVKAGDNLNIRIDDLAPVCVQFS
jgi:2-keto-4-pentenoate hydratase